jgi:regulator of replication initiation timing
VDPDPVADLKDKIIRQQAEIRELNARVAELIEQVTELEYDNTALRARQAAHVCSTPVTGTVTTSGHPPRPETWFTTIPRRR